MIGQIFNKYKYPLYGKFVQGLIKRGATWV